MKPALLGQLARVTRRVQPPGVDRMLRAVYSPDARRHDHFEAIVPYGRSMRMYCDTGSFVEWRIFFYGHYNEGVAHIIERHCRPGAVAIDIGANVGCNTLLMSERVGVAGRVIAIEPHPRIFERLWRNIELNALGNVGAIECAAGEQEGALTLFSPDAAHALTARATLYADNLDVGAQLAGGSERFDVRVRPVDAIAAEEGLGHIDFIKLDTQGHEMAVLAGARETIEAHRPAIVFKYTLEFWHNAGHAFADARAFFDALGYELFQVTRTGHEPLAGSDARNSDVLAIPR